MSKLGGLSAASIPASWVKILISEAVWNIPLTGKKIPQKQYLEAGAFPIVDQGQALIGGFTDDSKVVVQCNLPVIVFGDHTKVVKLVQFKFAPGADGVKVLKPHEFFETRLFKYFIDHITVGLIDKGYARHYQHLAITLIPIPPLAEQQRIVAKIEELFSELDQGIENLKLARAQLAVYRQALLKHAFEGKLTADWRTTHAHQLESADQLLTRIRTEREVRYKADAQAWSKRKGSADLILNGEVLTKPRKPKPPYQLDPTEVGKLSEVPSDWNWMTLESLASPAQRSIQSGPFGSSLKHEEFSETGMLVVGIDNVQKGYFSKGRGNRIPPKTYERLRKYSARPHDVLMTIMATVGRVCSVPADLETAIITKHVYRTSPNLALVDPAFLVHALLGSPATVKTIEKDKVGQTRPGINGDILKWLPIPLPPLEEQQEIMRVITSGLESVSAVEANIEENLLRAEALRQSILKKAFAGELVPQDLNDEPAAALLARIRSERAAAPNKKKLNRR